MTGRRWGAIWASAILTLSGCSGSSSNGGPPGRGDGGPVEAGSGAAGQGGGGTGPGGTGGSGTSGGQTGTGGAASAGGAKGAGGAPSGTGLHVTGNQLLGPDGKPFHGRGANLFDTRSCNACSFNPPDVAGLNRWADELLDGWHANFVRFGLWSWATADGRQQWKSVTQDPSYVADIENTVSHMTSKAGVYVMVTLFLDPSMKPDNGDPDSEWPTAATIPAYETITEALYDDPKVLFALTNEPHGPADQNADLAKRYVASIDAIRAVEKKHGVSEHVIVVQAPQLWSRFLDYFVTTPIARTNIAYEVHVYNPESDFTKLLDDPHKTLPIIVGEYGPSQYSTDADVRALWTRCQTLEIPHLAWSFHMRCDPNLLQDTASDGCGLSASSGYAFPRTPYGDMLHEYLATAW